MSSEVGKAGEISPRIRVTVDGSYIVIGNVPLSKMVIETDDKGYPIRWREVEKYPQRKGYALCRCGESKNKPYCDGAHIKAEFNGTETAGHDNYMDNVKNFDGPELHLTDNKHLCVGSGFCTRAGNIWNLTVHSDKPEYREIAIQEAADCPSGRLVVCDNQGEIIEPGFEPSIMVTEDEHGIPGPLWVRGMIPIESTEKIEYEVRNRVTLCNCGRSENKPLCDGAHLDT